MELKEFKIIIKTPPRKKRGNGQQDEPEVIQTQVPIAVIPQNQVVIAAPAEAPPSTEKKEEEEEDTATQLRLATRRSKREQTSQTQLNTWRYALCNSSPPSIHLDAGAAVKVTIKNYSISFHLFLPFSGN